MIYDGKVKMGEGYPLLRELVWTIKYVCSGENVLINDKELFYWLDLHLSQHIDLDLTSYSIIENIKYEPMSKRVQANKNKF